MPSDPFSPLGVALAVAKAFDTLGIAYFLGGSLASSVQGEPRATNDIDLVVELSEAQVEGLARALGADFEVDEEALREAVRRGTSWNIFHLPSMTKVDLFIRRAGAFDDSEFSRRRSVPVPGGALVIKSAEDTVLRKLVWFRQGGSVSSTQWRDVIEVLRVSGPAMDEGYLRRWAAELGVADLLDQALREAALD